MGIERCKAWRSELGLQIVAESEVLYGFKIFISEEWYIQMKVNFHQRVTDMEGHRCFIQATDDLNDKV